MNEEIISALLPAAMIENADGITDSFKKMSVNIDRVLRSDFASGEKLMQTRSAEAPLIIEVGEDDILREDVPSLEDGSELLRNSKKYEKPYITVPRVV